MGDDEVDGTVDAPGDTFADAALVDGALADTALADEAVELARALLAAALDGENRAERRRRRRLGRLLADAESRELVFGLTDRVLRIDAPRAAAATFRELVRRHGRRAFGPLDRVALGVGARLAPVIPRLVMPLVERRIRAETRGMVLPAEDPALARHLRQRREEGFEVNVNPLGEAVLSDAEADVRLAALLAVIGRDDVDYVSCKVSAVVANLDVVAFEHSVERVSAVLRTIYRAAGTHTFVNLDMEEYRDLDLTIAAFTSVLDEPEFAPIAAGIVLQAYLPDAHDAAARLIDWARARRHRDPHAGRIRVRLVKGANLAMELVEAELHGWTAAPYPTKADVDASFIRLLDTLFEAADDGIDVGLASHNLFDVAWGLVVAERRGVTGRLALEMLEGMAPAQARVLRQRVPVRLYTPVVASADFVAAIAYLSRRLDENTQAGNFLRALFDLRPDSEEFHRHAAAFRTAVADRRSVATARRRAPLPHLADRFGNEPTTDFTNPKARDRIERALAALRPPPPARVTSVAAIDAIVTTAAAAGARWVPLGERRYWLMRAAEVMRAERSAIVAAMAHETAKTVREGDQEVSEAIDFCEYYGRDGIGRLEALEGDGLVVRGRGIVCVVAPWNFPYAIPVGGVAAALAAGNAVILKPAPEAVGVGALVAEHFWQAGVPRDVLRFVACDDGEVGRRLVTHELVDTIVLTGSLTTASLFFDWSPWRRVLAETSGKNSIVVTASADLDLAIADTVRSAFGHAGQKCSAASLVIVDRSLYDGPTFLPRLREAASSIRVGPATDAATMMGPLIDVPAGNLERALTSLEPGESWLVRPRLFDATGPRSARDDEAGNADDPTTATGCLWSPGVRVGVRPGSWFHTTECFGPVLGVMRADDLDHAIDLANATPFGLTGGIHTLDPAEVAHWSAKIAVGNAYVNRPTTGAVVQRQPFGGWRHSRVGGGAKAGGPGYVLQLARIRDGRVPSPAAGAESILERAERSFVEAWDGEFAGVHDPSGLRAESNVLRYVPLRQVVVRHDGGQPVQLELCRVAARVSGVELVESDARRDDEATFVTQARGADRVRLLTSLADDARRMLHRFNVPLDDDPPVSAGDVELRRWVIEQTISTTTHRHGRLEQVQLSEPLPRLADRAVASVRSGG